MEQNSPIISVIIPVYNTSQYLKKCLDSVVNQTFSDIEIICFNDASTDNSLELLREYEKTDSRVKVIDSKVNIRQGGGRNAGLRIARGKFISFIDSDDWVEPTFLQELYNAIIENNADVSICDYYEQRGNNKEYFHLIGDITGLSQREIKIKIIKHGFRLWASLFEKNLFFKNNLFFPEKVVYEDNALGTALYLSADKIVKINRVLYFYRTDNASTTRSFNNYKQLDRITTSIMFYENVKRIGKYEEFEKEIDEKFVLLYYVNTIFTIVYLFDPIPIYIIKDLNNNLFKYISKEKFEKIYIHLPLKSKIILNLGRYLPYSLSLFSKMHKIWHKMLK